MNLEEEFEKIVHSVYEDIRARVRSGTISKSEGDQLIELVEQRLDPKTAGEYDQDFDMCAWQPSAQCW